jgi:hypothetical protein
MTVGYSTTIRTARMQDVADAINGGAGAGLVRIYDGTRPATGAAITTQNLLAELTCSDPVESSNNGVTMVMDAINDDPTANNTGTATWFRAVDSTGTFCLDGEVDDSAGPTVDMVINTVNIVSGAPVEITSWVITAGNQ